jgi:hypothetical protein
MTSTTDREQGDLRVREQVRAHYAELARRAAAGGGDDCGCGNPTAVADLHPG